MSYSKDLHSKPTATMHMHYFILLLLVATVSFAQEHLVPAFDVDGVEASYVVSLPHTYNADTSWPLILDFHGATSPDSKGAGLTRRWLWSKFVEHAPYIVVGVNSRTRSWGTIEGSKSDLAFALHILAAAQDMYPIDAEKIYLCGFSSGANFVCAGGIQREAKIAGNLVVCPGPAHSGRKREEGLCLAKDTPFAFVAGEEDYIGKDGAWQAFLTVEQAGGKATYREVPRLAHALPPVDVYIRQFESFSRPHSAATGKAFLEVILQATHNNDLLRLTDHLTTVKTNQAQKMVSQLERHSAAAVTAAAAIDAVAEPGRAYEAWWHIATQFHRFPESAATARAAIAAIDRRVDARDLYQARREWFTQQRATAAPDVETEIPAEPTLPKIDPKLNTRVTSLVEKLKSKESRQAARDEIIAIGKTSTPAMLKRMKDSNFTVRWEMVNIQGYMRDESAIEGLVDRVLRDSDPHVRWRAIWALNQYRSQAEAADMMRDVFKTGNESERWNAAVGLSMFKLPESLPAIHAGVAKSDKWERWEAINALARVNDETSASVLKPILSSKDNRERNEAVNSLGKIRGEKSVDILLQSLLDPDPGMRFRVCLALGRQENPRAIEPLNELKKTEQDKRVLEHIEKALASIPKP
jgi:HEAT repeat protein/predicted esterase